MNDFWGKLREQVQRVWEQLNTQQRVLFVSAPVMLLVTLGIAVFLAGRPQLVNLITADMEQIAAIQQYLEANGIEHVVKSETQIQVDESIKAETMLELASQNLITPDMGKGYELFDEFNFGMTDDLFKLNNKRALETKIARMIVDGGRSSSIKNAHVTIAIPSRAIFKEDETEPTASVKLVSSGRPSAETVRGIQNLVAAAVGNRMRAENVVVLDNNNAALSEDSGLEPGVKEANKRLEIKKQHEAVIANKVGAHLDELVGDENYVVEVNVIIDWIKESVKNVHIDGETPATVSQKNYTETTQSQGISGPPGVVSNTQDEGIGAEGETSNSSIEEVITNNRHPWVETITEKEQGKIENIVVSVLLNHHYDVNDELVAWTADELTQFEQLLRTAAGLPLFPSAVAPVNFVIQSHRFDDTVERALARERMIATATSIVQSMIPLILLFALGYFAYIFFQRAFAPPDVLEEEITDEIPIEPVSEAKELTLSQLGLAEFGDIASLPAEEQRRIKMQEHVINYAAEKPEEVATIIKSWLSQ